jgi:hypothetical protein
MKANRELRAALIAVVDVIAGLPVEGSFSWRDLTDEMQDLLERRHPRKEEEMSDAQSKWWEEQGRMRRSKGARKAAQTRKKNLAERKARQDPGSI